MFTGEKTGVRLVKVALSPGFPVWVRVELRRTQTGKPGDEAMVRAFGVYIAGNLLRGEIYLQIGQKNFRIEAALPVYMYACLHVSWFYFHDLC